MKKLLSVIGLFGSVTLCQAAVSFETYLDPFQEVPPHNTPGYGYADFTLSGMTLSVDATTGTYADLLAGATVVRLQDAPVGSSGPTVGTFNLDTPGNTSGTFSGSVTLTAGQVTDLQNGSLYLNIADSVFPGGEIRGQLEAAPEPVYLTGLIATSPLLALAMRRRKV